MRILVTGHRGQLATALCPLLEAAGAMVIGMDRDELDITDGHLVESQVTAIRPDLIINTAAYTAVDAAESDRDAAFAVNADGPRHLACAAAATGASLLHVSTDFVFDGRLGRAYRPTDQPNPLNVYGESKLAGERAVLGVNGRGLIVRTSWLYGPTGSNFLLTMLRLGREKQRVRVVDDQRGCPTSVLVLARWLTSIVMQDRGFTTPARIAHLACDGDVTWHGFATEIFRIARMPVVVEPIASKQFAAPARRPADSRLDCREDLATLDLEPMHWRLALQEVMASIDSLHAS